MPLADRTVTLQFDEDQWEKLSIEGARLGLDPGEVVARHADLLADDLVLAGHLFHDEDPRMLLDGWRADQAGAQAIQRVANRLGVTVEIDGKSDHHQDKQFVPGR
jgi:hypothetical protein